MGNEFMVGSKARKVLWRQISKNNIKKVAPEYKNPIKKKSPSNTQHDSVARAQKSQALLRPNPKEVGLSRAEIIDRFVKLHPKDGYVPVDKWIDGHHIIYDGPHSSIDEFGRILRKGKGKVLHRR